MIDYPISRLIGAVDAGATLTIRRTTRSGELSATLEHGKHSASAVGPDLAHVASTLVERWWTRGPIGRALGAQLDAARDKSGHEHAAIRPHMRAALGELGAYHGCLVAAGEMSEGYRATGCECDYCCSFETAISVAAAGEAKQPPIVGSDLAGIRFGK